MKYVKPVVGMVTFGEVNTPFERLQIKHDEAVRDLNTLDIELIDAGIVIDDPEYKTADAAIMRLKAREFSSLIICVAGWVPTHAVIRVADTFRSLPVVLWGLCGWRENGRLVTTADQAGTTAIRPALEAMGYRFCYVYSVIGKEPPLKKIDSYLRAANAAARLRHARIGSMGYRDMLLYGTQFEGNSMRGQLGVEVEPFEMLEMVQRIDQLDDKDIEKLVGEMEKEWTYQLPCDREVLVKGAKYALALAQRIHERGYDAITLIDVDGMKKLLGYPPAIVFMLLEKLCGVMTTPENDVMGNVTQLMLSYLTGQNIHYMEYYEFFEDSMLIGTPDYVPASAIKGDITMLPTSFGLLNASLLNVSKVKDGYVTCARLYYKNGRYYMHLYTAEARQPMEWQEFGWTDPIPQLCSLQVFPDSCTVEEFAQRVSSQHVLLAYGDHMDEIVQLCDLLNIEVVK